MTMKLGVASYGNIMKEAIVSYLCCRSFIGLLEIGKKESKPFFCQKFFENPLKIDNLSPCHQRELRLYSMIYCISVQYHEIYSIYYILPVFNRPHFERSLEKFLPW